MEKKLIMVINESERKEQIGKIIMNNNNNEDM